MAAVSREPSNRSGRPWLRLVAVVLALVVAGYVLYFSFAVQPSLWDALTNGANY